MNWFILIISILACYRLSLLFAKEDGPGKIFHKLRKSTPPKSSLRDGISCLLCESVWWSAFITGYLVYLGHTDWLHAPIVWLAISAGAIVLNQQFTKGPL